MDMLPGFVSDALAAYGDFVTTNVGPVIVAVVVVLVLLGSASLASSIAERRGRGPLLHFILGFIFPVLYPVVALAVVHAPEPKQAAPKEEVTEAIGSSAEPVPPPAPGPGKKRGIQAAPPPDIEHPTVMATADRFDQMYFKRIARDESGNPRGPFTFTIDGQNIRAERIVDVQEKLVVIETVDTSGRAQNLRVPYGRIEGVKAL